MCLANARAAGQTVTLLSNAPFRVSGVRKVLETIGVPEDVYDEIFCSGEVAWRAIRDRADDWHARLGRRAAMIGPDRHRPMLDNPGIDGEAAIAALGGADGDAFGLALGLGAAGADGALLAAAAGLGDGGALGASLAHAPPSLRARARGEPAAELAAPAKKVSFWNHARRGSSRNFESLRERLVRPVLHFDSEHSGC